MSNRKRKNCKIIYLSDEEQERLITNSEKCGLSRSEYIRQLIMECTPREPPPPELIRALYSISNSLNQIAVKANVLDVVDFKRYAENYEIVKKLIEELQAYFYSSGEKRKWQ